MKRTFTSIIFAAILSFIFSTTAYASDFNWDAYIAEMEQNSRIAAQNKANYDATATKLQKKVDALIKKSESENPAIAANAVRELTDLMSNTPDWSSNIVFPLTTALPPRAVLLKTGYRFDDASIGSGDLRVFVWVIEDGEVCACNMEALPETLADGGFHESFYKYLNHPTSGVVRNPDGSEWYWGDIVD